MSNQDKNAVQRILTKQGQFALRGDRNHNLSTVEVRQLGAKMIGHVALGVTLGGVVVGGTGLLIASESSSEPAQIVGHVSTYNRPQSEPNVVQANGRTHQLAISPETEKGVTVPGPQSVIGPGAEQPGK